MEKRRGFRPTTIVTLADSRDTHHFYTGQPIAFRLDSCGRLVPLTRWELARVKLRSCWVSATRWFRTRTVCAAVDREAGTVTLSTQRWSWTKWRWL